MFACCGGVLVTCEKEKKIGIDRIFLSGCHCFGSLASKEAFLEVPF